MRRRTLLPQSSGLRPHKNRTAQAAGGLPALSQFIERDVPEPERQRVSEVLLRSRYELTVAQLQAVLHRIAQEGWAQKKPGYGWEFSAMLTTPDSLLQAATFVQTIQSRTGTTNPVLARSTTARGVLAGAITPNHCVAS